MVRLIPFDEADSHSRRLREMSAIDQVALTDEQILLARHAYYKMSFLEPAARVPLFVSGLGLPAGRRVDAPVSLVDMAPTLLELADVEGGGVPMDGSSLAAFLSADPPAERPPVVCEYHAEGVNAPAAMIRSGAFKLIVCGDDPDQLFDLGADPLELTNLADSASRADVTRSLRNALAARLDLADERRVQRERRVVVAGLSRGDVAAWDYQPFVDASAQYVRTRQDLYGLQRLARLDAR